jgi:protein TonB
MKKPFYSYRLRLLQLFGVIVLSITVSSCSLFENEQNKHICDGFFIVTEQMPTLIGGMAELHAKVKYPLEAKEAGVEGRVTIQFIVDKLGKVRKAEVIRGIGAGADEEALRVVKTAKFEPGEQGGEPVCVQYALSINFRLEN